jgi:hypothetical protein
VDEFTTNPTAWAVEGNIVGEALGFLASMEIFTDTNCVTTAGTPQTVDGKTVDMVKITYQGA